MMAGRQRFACVRPSAGYGSVGTLITAFVLTLGLSGFLMWGLLEHQKPAEVSVGPSPEASSVALSTNASSAQLQTASASPGNRFETAPTAKPPSADVSPSQVPAVSPLTSSSNISRPIANTAIQNPVGAPTQGAPDTRVNNPPPGSNEQIQLRGLVVDQDGRGIPDADVRVVGDRVGKTRANASGNFALAMQRSLDGGFSVEVSHPQYESARQSVRTGAARYSTPLRVELAARDRNVAVTGDLTNMSGQPVPRSLLTLASSTSGFRYSMVSAPDGSFEFQSVGPASDYTLQIASDGQYRKEVAKDIAVDGADLHLNLTAYSAEIRGSLAVRFVDTLNRPVPGLTVVASSGAFGEIGWAKTDANGLAMVADAPDAQIVLRTSSGANCEIRSFTADPDRQRVDTVRLPTGDLVVGGRVTDTEKRPVAGASVVVSTRIQSDKHRLWCVREAITDADGVYAMRSIGAGEKTIRFKARAYESVQTSVTVGAASGSSEFSVQLRRSAEPSALTVMN